MTGSSEEVKSYLKNRIGEIINYHSRRNENNTEFFYGGFDMTGYGDSQYHNMEIMSKVKSYLIPKKIPLNEPNQSLEYRHPWFIFPIFWKGTGNIYRFDVEGKAELLEEVTSWGTQEIISKIVEYTNSQVLENISLELIEEKKKEEELIKTFTEKELEDFKCVKEISTLTQTIKVFKRNQKIVNELKKLYDNKCQICDFTFKKDNGENYSETHHLAELGENGIDNIKNLIVVCPNCHKKLHYAKKEKYDIKYKKEHLDLLMKEVKDGDTKSAE